jgi:hypothetical protein
MEEYVVNCKCCLCSFLDRPRENKKTSFSIIEALADIRTGHLTSTHRKHYRLSKLAPLRDVTFNYSHSRALHAPPSCSPSRDHPNYITKCLKYADHPYCPFNSFGLGTNIFCKIIFSNTLNLIFS